MLLNNQVRSGPAIDVSSIRLNLSISQMPVSRSRYFFVDGKILFNQVNNNIIWHFTEQLFRQFNTTIFPLP